MTNRPRKIKAKGTIASDNEADKPSEDNSDIEGMELNLDDENSDKGESDKEKINRLEQMLKEVGEQHNILVANYKVMRRTLAGAVKIVDGLSEMLTKADDN